MATEANPVVSPVAASHTPAATTGLQSASPRPQASSRPPRTLRNREDFSSLSFQGRGPRTRWARVSVETEAGLESDAATSV